MTAPNFTVPGMDKSDADQVIDILGARMVALTDLSLTLKHIHWNVVGPNFIAVHEMLDPQVEAIRGMVDEVAERIATLGGVPVGTPGALVERRTWDDYSLGRATVDEHLGALDMVYNGVNEDHRAAIEALDPIDLVSQDMLIAQASQMELFQWFVRAHLESSGGNLPTADTHTEKGAARAVS